MNSLDTLANQSKTARPATRIQREKREVILDAALELFSVRGYAGTTVDQIAAGAGMSKPNLLYYFSSKSDVYVALLDRQLDDWSVPLAAIDPTGDPITEIRGYIRRKLSLSRARPRESRLYASEILRGAPELQAALQGTMRSLVAEKALVIQGWIDAGRLAKIDPTHLIFAIWATTQHYADFDAQISPITGTKDDVLFATAIHTLETLFVDGLRPR